MVGFQPASLSSLSRKRQQGEMDGKSSSMLPTIGRERSYKRFVWNRCHLRMDEGSEILLQSEYQGFGGEGHEGPLRAETLQEDKRNLTYQLHSQHWQQAKMHF